MENITYKIYKTSVQCMKFTEEKLFFNPILKYDAP